MAHKQRKTPERSMKHVVTSLFTAMNRSRTGLARVGERTGAPAQGTPMTQLSSVQLRFVVGGDDGAASGPHGSWGTNPIVK